MMISFVLPMYNEEKNAEPLVRKIKKQMKGSYEIICVNDGSKDNTAQVLKKLAKDRRIRVITHKRNKGLGAALKTGFASAKGNVIITMDSDLTHRVEEIPRFMKKIDEGYDMVIGSRYVKTGKMVGVPIYRRIMSNFSNIFLRVMLGSPVKETTSGYRVIRRSAIRRIKLKSDGFDIQTEMVIRMVRKRLKIAEVPITLGTRKYGESKLNYKKVMWNTFKNIMKIRFLGG